MTDRLIDISENGARVALDTGRLLITSSDDRKISVALDDLGVLVLGHPSISISQPALSAIAESGGSVIVCSTNRMPCGMLLPLAANSTQQERIAAQVNAPLTTRKRIWQQIIRAKVINQGEVLKTLHGSDHGLAAMAKRVNSGDTANVEARAARLYWHALFPDNEFLRKTEGPPPNTHLNYGYAILRSMIGRAICAAGLHPSIGIHHHNRYNSFPLADDLMEPLRPLVDWTVVQICAFHGFDAPLEKETKHDLASALTGRVEFGGELRTVSDACFHLASELAQVFLNLRRTLTLPKVVFDVDERSAPAETHSSGADDIEEKEGHG